MSSAADPDFEEWVAARGDALARTAYLLTGDPTLAEDLVQTALIRVYRRWDHLDHEFAVDAYARRVLVHCWRTWWRRSLRHESPAQVVPDRVAPDEIGTRMLRIDLLRALSDLPPRQRAAVVLRYFNDLSESATAEAMGCSIGTVKSQTSRALTTLRGVVTQTGSEALSWRHA